jgi:hypothetical protein
VNLPVNTPLHRVQLVPRPKREDVRDASQASDVEEPGYVDRRGSVVCLDGPKKLPDIHAQLLPGRVQQTLGLVLGRVRDFERVAVDQQLCGLHGVGEAMDEKP